MRLGKVEHAVTEQRFPGLDIVELMLKQAVAEIIVPLGQSGLPREYLFRLYPEFHLLSYSGNDHIRAIEARIYCENPSAGFMPSPGILQRVKFPAQTWLRIESWVYYCLLIFQYLRMTHLYRLKLALL